MHDDIELQRAVLAELNWDPSVPAGQIGVTAKNGVVTLSGETSSYFGKSAAETAAARVKGVTAIVEEISVVLGHHAQHDDEDIATAAANRLASNGSIPKNRIIPNVQEGWISLRGTVDWNFEREAAEADVRTLAGVIGVVNHITITPRVNKVDVKNDIQNALHRSWFFDGDTIHVAVDGGTVRLTGSVDTLHDRKLAEQTAWAAPGAVKVENLLQIA